MSSGFTEEQTKYIYNDNIDDTKLIAAAGSGKTRCIIFRLEYLIKKKLIPKNGLLMLTFSRITRDDFINKIKKFKIESIDPEYVKKIDSFAKKLIDKDNEIDVSLLSYKLMKYLQNTLSRDIKANPNLSCIKTIFVDEAQDLNETQFNIISLLKEKNGTKINLIGDPNQNIYQFRNSSDKYFMNFDAETYYLTKNFRSYDPVINFSKFLRPVNNVNVTGNLGESRCKPQIVMHQDDIELEKSIIGLLYDAKKLHIDFSDIAILSPTRGRMRGYGKSHGLCFVSNLLYKNGINFKQFYEEATEEISTNIRYKPEIGHVNLLTYMGSKGLEWKFVILIDADICLINKRTFSQTKHKNDQYLLYVACSRAIKYLVVFSHYSSSNGNTTYQINPWFSRIPKDYYGLDKGHDKYLKYPKIKLREAIDNEKRITKIIDKFDEQILDELADLCGYGSVNNKITKTIHKIFEDCSTNITSNIFLGRYVESLFFCCYAIHNHLDKKKYVDIENIIGSKHIVTDVPTQVNEWFMTNRFSLSWESFDKEKKDMDKIIAETVEKKFSRDIELCKHTIVNDGYFKSFILSISDEIKENYLKYLKSNDTDKIRKYLFNINVITYALDTQHYFHALNRGNKFRYLLDDCKILFNRIDKFTSTTKQKFGENNVVISKWRLVGEIDLIENADDKKILWEIKCISDISLKHILQTLMYSIIYHNLDEIQTIKSIDVNFINLLRGEMINVNIPTTAKKIKRICELFCA